MRVVLIVAALGLSLSACVSSEVVAPTLVTERVMAPPDPIAGRDWHLYQNGGESRLAFGVAETDDLDLGLNCEDGSGRIQLFRDAPAAAPQEFRLDSAGASDSIAADSEPSAISDGQMLSAEAPVDLPVFQHFRSQGWIALWIADERLPLPSHPGTRADVERFFTSCA